MRSSSWYPADATFVTHVIPDDERIKKLVFPKAARTYSGIPVVHAVAFGDRGDRGDRGNPYCCFQPPTRLELLHH